MVCQVRKLIERDLEALGLHEGRVKNAMVLGCVRVLCELTVVCSLAITVYGMPAVVSHLMVISCRRCSRSDDIIEPMLKPQVLPWAS